MTAYLLDIEGTTTPVDFVHKVLFPFAKRRVGEFVQDNFGEIGEEIEQLTAEHVSDSAYGKDLDVRSPRSVAAYLSYLIDIDRKSTPLKSIQGKIWQAGYESGELRSRIFDDVPPAFERWTAAGKTIAIYSSGSILAQIDLFKYADRGDLTPFISNYFDTNIGGKKEADSYRKIAEELDHEPENMLFVSDILAELDAARTSGLQTALSIRPGNAQPDEDPIHRIIQSFDELP